MCACARAISRAAIMSNTPLTQCVSLDHDRQAQPDHKKQPAQSVFLSSLIKPAWAADEQQRRILGVSSFSLCVCIRVR